ncbi:hypothetical protein BH11PSE9_BH11PSE9_13110 [soil metagenome]
MIPQRWLWPGLAALLCLLAALGTHIEQTHIDWQPSLALTEPWRALTAVAVHYSSLHLTANLAGAALVAALGFAARVPTSSTLAWAAAWPLTQIGLLLKPELLHYGGLSGVLHAGVAVVAVHLIAAGTSSQRWVGGALLIGVCAKVLNESPWGPALRHPPGWDIAVAPLAHATGLIAGVACALVAEFIRRRAARRTSS